MTGITILDGGMGRYLKQIGAPFRQPEWSALALMEAPDFVARAHTDFIAAGAQVVTTSNYAVVPFHIGEERFVRDGAALTALAGRLAREAADASDRPVTVAGSLPPLYGSYRPDYFDAAGTARHLPGIVDALEEFVDVWQGETIGSVAEFETIAEVLADRAAPFYASFSLRDEWTEGEPVLRSGESLSAMLNAVLASEAKPVSALLFNCSCPEVISLALPALRRLLEQRESKLPIGAYANAYTPRAVRAEANAETAVVRDEITPALYARTARQWVGDGASIVGGCCGIGPEHIAETARVLAS